MRKLSDTIIIENYKQTYNFSISNLIVLGPTMHAFLRDQFYVTATRDVRNNIVSVYNNIRVGIQIYTHADTQVYIYYIILHYRK